MNDDFTDDGTEPACPVCGYSMFWQCCENGCDDGYFDLYDEDPLWYNEDDQEACEVCEGKGGYWLCLNAANHPPK